MLHPVAQLAQYAERVIEVAWRLPKGGEAPLYPVDVTVQASDRQGLLRDVLEVFAKEKLNVVGAQTQTVKGVAWMTLTAEVADSGQLGKVLATVAALPGVRTARRR